MRLEYFATAERAYLFCCGEVSGLCLKRHKGGSESREKDATMADSEFRVSGILAKYAYAFEKAGGDPGMLKWVADRPERMAKIVEIADGQVLKLLESLTIKRPTFEYVPSDWFQVGTREGVTISTIEGFDGCIPEGSRALGQFDIAAYESRKPVKHRDIHIERWEEGLPGACNIDHLWWLLFGPAGTWKRKFGLLENGDVNVLYMQHPFSAFPVHVWKAEGWEIRRMNFEGLDDPRPDYLKGTRFYFPRSE
jgi:hypothetical protein